MFANDLADCTGLWTLTGNTVGMIEAWNSGRTARKTASPEDDLQEAVCEV